MAAAASRRPAHGRPRRPAPRRDGAPHSGQRPRVQLSVQLREQLHQNFQVHGADVSASEPLRAVPAARQLLFPVPAGAAADPGHLVADMDHHRGAAYRCAAAHRHQGRLR